MSFQTTRGKVIRVDEHFTHVRSPFTPHLFLFGHRADNPAPEELRKEGAEVEVFQGPCMGLFLRPAPERSRIPQRGAAPKHEEPPVTEVQRIPPLVAPKIPLRRR